MPRNNWPWLLTLLILSACASKPKELQTISTLKYGEIKLEEPKEEISIDPNKVREYYREFLSVTNENKMYSEALRRLADMELKSGESSLANENAESNDGKKQALAAIKLYQTYLKTYPHDPANDLIMYQLAKAYELTGQTQRALDTFDKLSAHYPQTRYRDEINFRRGEMYFVLKRYEDAELAYAAVINSKDKEQSVFYEKALYKYGWSHFKQNRYKPALNAFFAIMDRKQIAGMLKANQTLPELEGSEKELLDDTLRAISLCFAYAYGEYSIAQFFEETGQRPYEPLIYLNLGKLYLEKDRVKDAADTFMTFVKRNPTSALAPEFHTEAIKTYQKGGLITLVIPAKEEFVRLYGVGSAYWELQNTEARERIRPLLGGHITELASHFYAQARASKKSPDYLKAAEWYGMYLKNLPNDKNVPQMHFLMAEAFYDGRYFVQAIPEFEKTAYGYPEHAKSAEAGYAAILSYTELEKATPPAEFTAQHRQNAISSALKFSDTFTSDKRVPSVLTKTAEQLYNSKDYLRAASTAQRLVKLNIQDPNLKRTYLVILGHSEYELKNYAQAQQAYRESLNVLSNKDPQYSAIYDRLAASIYNQGEQARDKGDLQGALALFLSVRNITPASSLRPTADYDAAATMIQLKDYQKASTMLENFRKEYPDHKLTQSIPEKLAFIYSETGQTIRAANEMEKLALANRGNREYSRSLLWQAGTYFEKGKHYADAKRVFSQYIQDFPSPFEQSVEARHKLSEIARVQGDGREWGRWLQDVIRTDAGGGAQRTDRTRFLAASATLLLAQGHFNVYRQARLTHPLKQSLARKRELMQNAIKAYEGVTQYRVAEVTTSATYQIAEIYADFGKAILNSDRPDDISKDALAEYQSMVEELAFPFEEKAIEIHSENIKLMRDGTYDDWTKRSLNVLRKMQPGRYAKFEQVEKYVDTIY